MKQFSKIHWDISSTKFSFEKIGRHSENNDNTFFSKIFATNKMNENVSNNFYFYAYFKRRLNENVCDLRGRNSNI